MIYCFKACSAPCDILTKACDGCSKGCKNCNLCEPCNNVMGKPLGRYVMLTVMINLPVAILAGYSLADAAIQACKNMLIFCVVNLVSAIINMSFAFYAQHKLTEELDVESQQGQTEQLTSHDLMQKAGKIVVYDIGFCFFVFAFVASFFFNCVGLTWNCTPVVTTTCPSWASGLLIFYTFAVVTFMGFWYCALWCDDWCCWGFGRRSPTTKRSIAKSIVGEAPMQHEMLMVESDHDSEVSTEDETESDVESSRMTRAR